MSIVSITGAAHDVAGHAAQYGTAWGRSLCFVPSNLPRFSFQINRIVLLLFLVDSMGAVRRWLLLYSCHRHGGLVVSLPLAPWFGLVSTKSEVLARRRPASGGL